jgi:hypothetical protein
MVAHRVVVFIVVLPRGEHYQQFDSFSNATGLTAARPRVCSARGMTYNFDPERWYTMQSDLLTARHARGELDQTAFEQALVELDRRYDELVSRLDGTYQLPSEDRDE